MRRQTDEENWASTRRRFMASYSVAESGCWEFTGLLAKNGYGRISVGKKMYLAHRISYIFHNGQIPVGQFVLHRCDNPKCVNPDHLFLGTQRDNLADMTAKGRRRTGRMPGDANGRARITSAQADEIRRRYAASGETLRGLGEEFGLHNSTVHAIIARKLRK